MDNDPTRIVKPATIQSEKINSDFLSNHDKNYIFGIVTDWLVENGHIDVEEITFSITVDWRQ